MDEYKPPQTICVAHDGEQFLVTGVGADGRPVRIELSEKGFDHLFAQVLDLFQREKHG
jgi:hypothetical protein